MCAQPLDLLTRFGSVTVLGEQVHQTLQKIEGKVAFHTARSTAFPHPAGQSRVARPDQESGRRSTEDRPWRGAGQLRREQEVAGHGRFDAGVRSRLPRQTWAGPLDVLPELTQLADAL
jgi:hypothetical protein